jgi:hypothetical protein
LCQVRQAQVGLLLLLTLLGDTVISLWRRQLAAAPSVIKTPMYGKRPVTGERPTLGPFFVAAPPPVA